MEKYSIIAFQTFSHSKVSHYFYFSTRIYILLTCAMNLFKEQEGELKLSYNVNRHQKSIGKAGA